MVWLLQGFKPIPITEDWLRKTEINQMQGIHNSKFSGLISVKYSKSVNKWEFFIGTISITFIDYLHELQKRVARINRRRIKNNPIIIWKWSK